MAKLKQFSVYSSNGKIVMVIVEKLILSAGVMGRVIVTGRDCRHGGSDSATIDRNNARVREIVRGKRVMAMGY